MDTHTGMDANNPINQCDEYETCKYCHEILENEKEEMICQICDKCIYCGEMLNECDCTDG